MEIKNGRMIPTAVSTIQKALDLKNSPLFSNIQYTLQYLEVLDFQLKSISTTDTVMKIFYKNYLINAMSVIESIFLNVLRDNKEMPTENYTELYRFPTGEKLIEGNLIKAETIIYKKTKPFEKKNTDFETMINKINSKKLLTFNRNKFLTIKTLKYLRNKVHLFIADSFDKSDYNSFSYKEYIWSKYALYSVLTDKNICIIPSSFDAFKLTHEEMQYLVNYPLITEK